MFLNFLSTLLISFVFGFTLHGQAQNYGHRAGADVIKHLAENTALILKESIQTSLQHHPHFVYVECDIRETKDNQLVVFHDSNLKRLMVNPHFGPCRKKRGAQKQKEQCRVCKKVSKMTLGELRRYQFKQHPDERIPTLREFLSTASQNKLQKPLILEIKQIDSHQGMDQLIDDIAFYLNNYGLTADINYLDSFDFPQSAINLMCFPWNVPKPLKNPHQQPYWQQRLQEVGIQTIFQTRRHKHKLWPK